MAQVVRVVRNPADPSSGIKAWSNGYLEAFGDAPPVSFAPRWASDPVSDLWVLPGSWAAPRGLVFTVDGARHGFGDPAPAGWGPPLVGGEVYGHYRWLVMDPAGTGRGWAVTCFLQVVLFGAGAVGPSPAPTVLSSDMVRDFIGDYSSGKWLALYGNGGMQSSMGVAGPSWSPSPGQDRWRRIALHDGWGDAFPPFYVASAAGQVGSANGAPAANRGPVLSGRGDTLRGVDVISPEDPLVIELTEASGAFYRYTVSGPPSVTVVAPSGTITDTRTPQGGWVYSDPNRDSQVEARVAWFSSAQYGVGGFDPGSSPAAERQTIAVRNRTVAAPVTQLDDGDWRMYVRVKDSADQWSDWAYAAFEIDVDAPEVPALTVAPVSDHRVEVTVTGEGSVDVEVSDDGGVSWAPMWGSPIEADSTVHDPEAPFNVERSYRARSVVGEVRSDWSAVDEATVVEGMRWVLSIGSDRLVVNDHAKLIVPPGLEEDIPWGGEVHDPLSGVHPVVVRGDIRSERHDLVVRWFSAADRDAIDAFLARQQAMLLRTPYGVWRRVELAGAIRRSTVQAQAGEPWGSTTIPVVVVG